MGAVIGTEEFKEEYVGEKVSEWVKEVDVLSDIARTEPQAAYSAFMHDLRLTIPMEFCHAHNPRHQPSPQTAWKLRQKHLPTSAAEIPYSGGRREDAADTSTKTEWDGDNIP